MNRPFGLILSTLTTASLLLFAPACDVEEDESDFRYIPLDGGEEEPPCECVCIDEIPDDGTSSSGEDPTGPGSHGGGNGKGNGKGKTKDKPRDEESP